MAVKTFTSTTVSTSDVNTYLANAGLVYITQASATSGNSLTVQSVFSATYSNYRILIDGYQPATAGTALLMRLRSTSDADQTDYYAGYRGLYADGTSSDFSQSAATYFEVGIYNSANTIPIGNCSMDVFGPNRAERTYFSVAATLYAGKFGSRVGFAEHNLTTAYSGFTLFPSSGNFTNVRVWVYGYRNS